VPFPVNTAPFFIVGSDRSGTTLLRLMLSEHSLLHVPRESWFLIKLMSRLPARSPLTRKQVQIAYDIITTHWRWKDWEIEDRELWDRLKHHSEPSLSELIDAVFRLSSVLSGKPRWGDKTPEYVMEIDRLHTVFPEAQFIHIIRDGRDVCLSLMKYKWRGIGLRQNAMYWAKHVAAGIESGKKLPKHLYLQVAYEDLVLDTENTLTKVCQFLDVAYSPLMLGFHKNAAKSIAPWEQGLHHKTMRPPSPDDVHRWRREMGLVKLIAFEAIAGGTMDKANQVRRFSGVYRAVPQTLAVVYYLADLMGRSLSKLSFLFRHLRPNS